MWWTSILATLSSLLLVSMGTIASVTSVEAAPLSLSQSQGSGHVSSVMSHIQHGDVGKVNGKMSRRHHIHKKSNEQRARKNSQGEHHHHHSSKKSALPRSS